MKKLTIEIEFADQNNNVARKALDAKSEANMWNLLREVRDQLTDQDLLGSVTARVFTEDGTLFKDITFKRNSKGKIEMPNAVKETRRARKREAEDRFPVRQVDPTLLAAQMNANPAPANLEPTKAESAMA